MDTEVIDIRQKDPEEFFRILNAFQLMPDFPLRFCAGSQAKIWLFQFLNSPL